MTTRIANRSGLAAAAALSIGCGGPDPSGLEAEIEAILHRHIAVLASDEFEGRAPATPGEEKTVNYLREEFERLGVEPGNRGAWFQPVEVTEIAAVGEPSLRVRGDGADLFLRYGEEMVVGTPQQVPGVSITDSDMVFVGYGIVAPERGWDDYAGVDARGKTVVILVNDPGYASQDPALFNGNAMTYYGRWVYKYAEAARQGAMAALVVHETGPAGYGWEVVSGSWTGPQIGLTAPDRNLDRTAVEGWLSLEAAETLFAAAGLDWEALKSAAARPGFRAVPMGGLRASANVRNTVRSSVSRNVIAAIPGSTRPEEAIVYTAHWDHLGVAPAGGAVAGDAIYNGAADNATGTAGLLALAWLHKRRPPPERTIVFLAVTAEESGLLGSQWYVENPVWPLADTVANINMDNLNTVGRARDVVVVGAGGSELERYLERAAAAQGRRVEPEPNPERGYYYRSDHFNFARAGVPALYAESGEDDAERGREYGAARAREYNENRYHQPSDEYDPDWDLGGAAQDILLYFEIADRLARETAFPEWFEGNEFKAVRDASRRDR